MRELSCGPKIRRFAEAESLIDGAIGTLHNTGQKQELALALISRAALADRLQSERLVEIKSDIAEAYDIAKESRSSILLVEAYSVSG